MPRKAKQGLPRTPSNSRVLPGEMELDDIDEEFDVMGVRELASVALSNSGSYTGESFLSSDDAH